jgi:hypothetical protein
LAIAGGTISGGGSLRLGNLTWGGGEILDLPDVQVTGSVTFTAAARTALTNSVLTLSGSTVWSGGNIEMSNATIINKGTFDIRTDGFVVEDVNAPSQFLNVAGAGYRGQVKKTAGAGTTTFEPTFSTSGDLQFNGRTMAFEKGLTEDVGGVIDLDGGTMDIASVAGLQNCTLNGGILRGGGTITGNLTNNGGLVQLGSGWLYGLAVNGNYTQGARGTLEIDMYSEDFWGQLQVGQQASLAGQLTVWVAPGYTPAQGLQKNIIGAADGVSGTFAAPGPAGWDVLFLGSNFVSIQKQ